MIHVGPSMNARLNRAINKRLEKFSNQRAEKFPLRVPAMGIYRLSHGPTGSVDSYSFLVFRRDGSNETYTRIPLKRSSVLAQMTQVFDDKEAMDDEWGISNSEHPEPPP